MFKVSVLSLSLSLCGALSGCRISAFVSPDFSQGFLWRLLNLRRKKIAICPDNCRDLSIIGAFRRWICCDLVVVEEDLASSLLLIFYFRGGLFDFGYRSLKFLRNRFNPCSIRFSIIWLIYQLGRRFLLESRRPDFSERAISLVLEGLGLQGYSRRETIEGEKEIKKLFDFCTLL